jgi:diacylglycerol kinase (ATP)
MNLQSAVESRKKMPPQPRIFDSPVTIDRFRCETPCRVLVFASPKAGSGQRREQLPRLMNLLAAAGVDHQWVDSIWQLKNELQEGPGNCVVVAAGGDGTISLAASIVSPTCPLVPMPLGTENLLARQFGHTAQAEDVIRTIRHGHPLQLDAGLANDRPFLIMTTCGFDAEVVRGMHLTRRGHIRRWSYFGPIIRALRKYRFPELTIRIDGEETLQCCWAMVFNLPRYGGGLKIEPDAEGNDGMLDVIMFQGGSIFSGIKYVCGIWAGLHLKFADIQRRRGRVIEITSVARVPYEMDGDYVGRLPLQIKVAPCQLQLLLPVSKEVVDGSS